MKKTFAPTLATLALALALPACGDTDTADGSVASTQEAGDASLNATVAKIDEVSTAYKLVEKAGLKDPFDGAGAYTVFLPDNEAFAKLPKEDLELLGTEEGRPELIAILRRHIAVGAITREDLDEALDANGGSIQLASVADQPIDIRKVDGEVRVGSGSDAPKLTKLAVPASNGVVYVIDGLIPPGG